MLKSKLCFLFFFGFGLIALQSCEKVIDVNLKNASPVIVIEGVVTNRVDSQYVQIRRTASFDQPNVFPEVSGAVVTISDGTGRVVMLREKRPGYYVVHNFTGRSGRTYSLKVLVDGNEYTAQSTMPNQVNIDSIGISVTSFFDEERKIVQLIYKDPAKVKNYYRYKLKINGKSSDNIFAFDDSFTDGRTVNRELFDFDLSSKSGDKAEIEMQCIDASVFRYWQGVDQNQSRGGASTTPANPISNISNGALGYFSAHTVQNEDIIIP